MSFAEPVDDLCAQLGCLDRGICNDDRYAEPPYSCHRATAVAVEAARPYDLKLAVWRAFLARIGLGRLLPKEPRQW